MNKIYLEYINENLSEKKDGDSENYRKKKSGEE
jgi:hypothetical protein